MAPRELGVSIVWWPELEPLLSAVPELLDALEVEPQALWVESPHAEDPYRIEEDALAQVLAHPQPKLAHGVGFPVGSARRPDRRAFPTLVRSIEELAAAWASEHLGVNRALGPDGLYATGFLLPPRQTDAGVEEAAASIRATAAELPVPFAFETGVNYLRPREDELDDGAFAAAVAETADCGILLDLHNLYVNERNGRQPAREFVAQLPLERVWEVHLAGGFEYEGYWLDAHSGRMPEPLVELAEEVLPQLPAVGALTFELLPDFFPEFGIEGVARELAVLRRLWERRATAVAPPRSWSPRLVSARGPSPLEWEDALGGAVAGRPNGALGAELAADPGVGVLRSLVHELRAGMTVDALRLTTRLLALSLGSDGLRSLLEEHWEQTPPALFAATEADAFAGFLAARRPSVPYLADVLAFERAWLAARSGATGQQVVLGHEPDRLLAPLAEGRLPEGPPAGRFEVLVEA
jgi:uncharacterized protein (UPF0276 family)